jgi:hypothetical protein
MPHNKNASRMPSENDPLKLEDPDRQVRIKHLRDEISKLAGGEVCFGQSDCPPEVLEQFLKQVLEFERADATTHLELLGRQGIRLPPPEELDDDKLHDVLWEIIHGLAQQRTFLYHTDHLSDRQLYEHLWKDSVRESATDLQGNADAFCGIDLVSGGSDEDIAIDMKYYADEVERAMWLDSCPDFPMPPHEDPPYDRDRFLPRAGWPWDGHRPDSGDGEDKEKR